MSAKEYEIENLRDLVKEQWRDLTALYARVAELEKRLAAIDARTASSIRYGPMPQPEATFTLPADFKLPPQPMASDPKANIHLVPDDARQS